MQNVKLSPRLTPPSPPPHLAPPNPHHHQHPQQTQVQKYGAFVNCGLSREGLLHISQMRDGFTADPLEVVQVGQEVTVKVLAVDLEQGRLQLTMRSEESREKDKAAQARKKKGGQGRKKNRAPDVHVAVGEVFPAASVSAILRQGYKMKLNDKQEGLLKTEELLDEDDDDDLVSSVQDFQIAQGDALAVFVKDVDKRGNVYLGLTPEGAQEVAMRATSLDLGSMATTEFLPALGALFRLQGVLPSQFPSTGKVYMPPARAFRSDAGPQDLDGQFYATMVGTGPGAAAPMLAFPGSAVVSGQT